MKQWQSIYDIHSNRYNTGLYSKAGRELAAVCPDSATSQVIVNLKDFGREWYILFRMQMCLNNHVFQLYFVGLF